MYRSAPKEEIAATLVHLRGLFRRSTLSKQQERLTHERREVITKNLLSNLSRTKEHPTLSTVMEVADIFSLTLEGAHRLFGYDLEQMRKYDFLLNRGRTHIIESYPFRRDLLIDLPRYLASEEVFRRDALLHDLVPSWQIDVPIRALEEQGWLQPGAFYVHVGTEDSLGSSLPPGSMALVEPISQDESLRPNPRSNYLLQFGNGYRCSRCVVTRGKLLLLTPGHSYVGPQEFRYPGGVRIAGRIRAFALSLPLPEHPLLRSLPTSTRSAPLILPWEHPSLDRLFSAKHLRFQRSAQEQLRIRQFLEGVFHTRLSERTERRYRYPTRSQPHVDTLLQLTLKSMSRYTDALRAQRMLVSDTGRFSLQTLLNAMDLNEVSERGRRTHLPQPRAVWEERRKEFPEWPTLLSAQVPQLRSWDDRVIRLAKPSSPRGIQPPLSTGTLLVLDKVQESPHDPPDAKKWGWARSLYALRRGTEFFCGHLDRVGDQFALFEDASTSEVPIRLGQDELGQLRRVVGV